ncbi:hypothetical protein PQX77_002490 [Marasmius sp. AFHP31]|nr:hypothetical protein PQX77_002490 [Marasmius sp. AFHP31]
MNSSNIQNCSMLSKKVLKSFEGKTGAVFEADGVFVTSPNTDFIAFPLCGIHSIRLRQNYHFGEDDPLYFPQPFSHQTPHLAVIPFPTSDPSNPHSFAWRILQKDTDFVPVDLDNPVQGLGRLSNTVRLQMRTSVDKIVSTASSLGLPGSLSPENIKRYKEDRYVRTYLFSLKFLVARAATLASFREVCMSFALCQRAYLELVARLDWYTTYMELLSDPPVSPRAVGKVVGALVGDDESCERLYRAGIPVWYTRSLNKKEGLRVDKWVDQPTLQDEISLRDTGVIISLRDAQPPHKTVYSGPVGPRNIERYAAMGGFLREFATTNIYMDQPDPSPGENTGSSNGAAMNNGGSTGPTRSSKANNKRSRPYPPHNPKTHSTPLVERNKFVDVVSSVMPVTLPTWGAASSQVGQHFDPNTPAIRGAHPGYALPDPNFVAGTANEVVRAQYVTTLLKLRPLLHYRLRSPTFSPLKPQQWRSIVGMEAHSTQTGTRVDARRIAMASMLKECLISGQMEVSSILQMSRSRAQRHSQGTFDIDRLDRAPVQWAGQDYDQAGMPPVQVAQQLLWELFEINFRYELVALDRHCHTTTASKGEREMEVLCTIRHFEGAMIPAGVESSKQGFASEDLYERRDALLGLFTVMQGWSGGRFALTRTLLEGGGGVKKWERQDIRQQELERFEQALVLHYVSTFATVFGRAPLLPHRL